MGKQVNLGVIISSNYAVNKANEISQVWVSCSLISLWGLLPLSVSVSLLNNRQLWQMEPYPHRSREALDLKSDVRDGCHERTRLIQALTDFPSKTNQQTAGQRGGKWLLLEHACNQGTEFK
ncbi:hypothetical protein ABG768_013043 [Culter alburnus]|uniref:Uncharacterized protein n=1 Tax=Culter alburnus TaxID=194366 RepID=A0AAW2B4A0_CULAL